MYFEGEHIKFVKQEMPALKSDFLMNIATSCMHNLLAGFLVLTNNLTIYCSSVYAKTSLSWTNWSKVLKKFKFKQIIKNKKFYLFIYNDLKILSE